MKPEILKRIPQTFIVTGCFGFIGSNLVVQLLKEGHRVVGFDNLTNPSIEPTARIKQEVGVARWSKFKFYKLDVRDKDIMKTIAINERATTIIHLAASGSVPKSFVDPMEYVRNNEMGFVSVMLLAFELRLPVVYASSSSVYGDHPDFIRIEGREGRPLSPYALSKKQNEEFAKCWGHAMGVKTIGLRFFNVYGPGQRPDSAFAPIIPKLITAKQISIFGDGEAVRDFTYVEDVCKAICAAAYILESTRHDKEKSLNDVFNVGTGKGCSINSLISILRRIEDVVYKERRNGDVQASVASPTCAKFILKFEAQTELADGLKKTHAYYSTALLAYKDENGQTNQYDTAKA